MQRFYIQKALFKRIALMLSVVSVFICSFMLPVSAEFPGDSYREGNAIVIRFDSVPAISKAVSSTFGSLVGFLDHAMECRFIFSPGIVMFEFQESNTFPTEEYPYMKIKYFNNTISKGVSMYFSVMGEDSISGHRTMNFNRRRRGSWVEDTFDMSRSAAGWEGNLKSVRLDLCPQYYEDADEYMFIEYIAFFQTEEEADSFGGITEEQAAGTDLISLYAKGYRTSRVDKVTYTVPGKESETTNEENLFTTDVMMTESTTMGGELTFVQTCIILFCAVVVSGLIIGWAVKRSSAS